LFSVPGPGVGSATISGKQVELIVKISSLMTVVHGSGTIPTSSDETCSTTLTSSPSGRLRLPGEHVNGSRTIVPSGIVSGSVNGTPLGTKTPVVDLKLKGGVNPDGRGKGTGNVTPRGIRTGLPTDPPYPQQVAVISRPKSQVISHSKGRVGYSVSHHLEI